MPVPAVQVKGLRELQRAFALADRATRKELRAALALAAEPIARDAEELARANIRRIGEKWPQMRIGVTQKLIYVAPKQRGRLTKRNPARYRRPNLFDLLFGLMERSLDENIDGVEASVGRALDRVGDVWERA